MSRRRYQVESYADDASRFYVYEYMPDGCETIHAGYLPSLEAAQAEALRLEAANCTPDLVDALRGMLHRYPENPGTYTPEGARARAVLARLTGWTS